MSTNALVTHPANSVLVTPTVAGAHQNQSNMPMVQLELNVVINVMHHGIVIINTKPINVSKDTFVTKLLVNVSSLHQEKETPKKTVRRPAKSINYSDVHGKHRSLNVSNVTLVKILDAQSTTLTAPHVQPLLLFTNVTPEPTNVKLAKMHTVPKILIAPEATVKSVDLDHGLATEVNVDKKVNVSNRATVRFPKNFSECGVEYRSSTATTRANGILDSRTLIPAFQLKMQLVTKKMVKSQPPL